MLATVRSAIKPFIPSTESGVDVDTEAESDVDLDDFFQLLRNSRRRQIIRYLIHETDDGTATKRELAGHIAAIENEIPVDELSSQQRKRVYIGIHQSHLDKMVDSSLIEYTDRDTLVEATPATYVAAGMLEDADRHFTGGGA